MISGIVSLKTLAPRLPPKTKRRSGPVRSAMRSCGGDTATMRERTGLPVVRPFSLAKARAPPAKPQASASQKGSSVLVDISRSASQFISTSGSFMRLAATPTGTAT